MSNSGQCSNFGNCSIADERKSVDVPSGQDLACPECGRPLMLVARESTPNRSAIVVLGIGAVLFLLVGGAAWYFLTRPQDVAPTAAVAAPSPPPAQPPPPPTAAAPVLRFAGSNTIGKTLMPALAEAFLQREGASAVRREPLAAPVETRVVGTFPNGPRAVEIKAHGTSTAFEALRQASAEIAMASRRITPPEIDSLRALGDMTATSREHVLAVDGVAIIVNADNPLSSISADKLAGAFAGELTQFAQLGGGSANVALYARDDASGTFDVFQQLVLRDKRLSASARRFEDGGALVAAVAKDPGGLGFVSMSQANAASGVRTLAVAAVGGIPLVPTRLTVGTEDYVLSRRLYLYVGDTSNDLARNFIEFALSRAGQEIVTKAGFLALTVQREASTPDAKAPPDYKKFTAGATRLTTNFRFRTGSSDLDNRALRDLERVTDLMVDLNVGADKLLLFGFADSTGSPAANDQLSAHRAESIASSFRQRGLTPGTVRGFGQSLPIADNNTPEGREKNRRVEVWVRKTL